MIGVALPGHKLTRTVCGGGLGAPTAEANLREGALARAHCEALRAANGGAWALRWPCLGSKPRSSRSRLQLPHRPDERPVDCHPLVVPA